MGFRAEPAGVVEGPVDEGMLNLLRDYRRARALTDHAMKFTLTGPHMLTKTLMDHHYKSKPELAMAIGRALARQVRDLDPQVIQVDEANIPGHPEEGDWAADAINLILDAAGSSSMVADASMENRPRVEKAVHICFGNYGGQSIQKGEWVKLIGFMNKLHCNHVVLEFAYRGYDELVEFRELLDPRIGLGLGVIDIKVNTVESPELVAWRIEQATKIVGPGRIKWVHPDCGFWMNKRSIADRKMASLVKGRDLFLGRK
jgi:5-methyltetrahydropteroyltriglutamate--homocysteine methyltransferase